MGSMDLEALLQNWDGKRVESLAALAERIEVDDALLDDLWKHAAADDAKLQTGATWVLKRWLEKCRRLSPARTRDALRLIETVSTWEARLHVLQMLPFLSIPAREKTRLHRTLHRRLEDDNKLIRAWTYNGFFVLADQHSEFREETILLLANGAQDEAASVRARIRNIMKSASWA